MKWCICLLSAKIKETFGKDVEDEFRRENVEILLSVCKECQDRHAQMRELDRDPDFFDRSETICR